LEADSDEESVLCENSFWYCSWGGIPRIPSSSLAQDVGVPVVLYRVNSAVNAVRKLYGSVRTFGIQFMFYSHMKHIRAQNALELRAAQALNFCGSAALRTPVGALYSKTMLSNM